MPSQVTSEWVAKYVPTFQIHACSYDNFVSTIISYSMPCNVYTSAEQPYNPMDPSSMFIVVDSGEPFSYTECDLWHAPSHQS